MRHPAAEDYSKLDWRTTRGMSEVASGRRDDHMDRSAGMALDIQIPPVLDTASMRTGRST